MSSSHERTRNNIRTGVFVSASLILALVIVVALTDMINAVTRSTEEYVVEFSVRSGVRNLKSGSEVRVGGVRLGEVTRIEPNFGDGQRPVFETIDVVFRLDEKVRLYRNAKVFTAAPLIGAEAWLDIPDVGDAALGPPPGNRLHGADTIGLITALLGHENADRAGEMVENAAAFTQFLASLPDEYQQRVIPIIDDVRSTTVDARELLATIRHQNWPQWSDRVSEIMTWASGATERIDGVLDEGRGLFTDARDVIGENRDNLRSGIESWRAASENFREVGERVNNESVDRLNTLLDNGNGALDDARAAIATFRQDYDGWATNFGEALAKANLAAQQLKLTTVEVRRSPWKLLYRPSEKELEHELLYEAARSFAMAASDLKAASASVQRVLQNHSEVLADDPAALEQVRKNLLEPLSRYEQAQQRLLDVLFLDAPQ